MLAGVGWVVADLKKFCVSCTFSLTRFFLLDTIGYAMIGATSRQSWLFYLPLARQASLLKDDLLDPVDKLLEDSALVELVRQSLAGGHPPLDTHRTPQHRPRPSAALLCDEAPKGMELPGPGARAAQQPGVPTVHAVRRRSHARFLDL